MSRRGRRQRMRSVLSCLGVSILVGTPSAAEILPMSVETQESLVADCGGDLDFGTIWRRSGYAGNATVAVAAAAGARAEPSGGLVVSGGSSVACRVDGVLGTLTATLSGGGASDAFETGSSTLPGVRLLRQGGGALLANVTVTSRDGTFYIGGVLSIAGAEAAPDGTYTSDAITITVTDDGMTP
jgi:hypothetical protein